MYGTDTKETAYIHNINWNAQRRITNNVVILRNKILQTVEFVINFILRQLYQSRLIH